MNKNPFASDAFINFIRDHISDNPSSLFLKYHGKILDFDLNFALTQIECRQKTKRKLKRFLSNEQFLFPSTLSAEQASHEAVADFHASLIEERSTLLDMTAGLGIDFMTMAAKCSHAVACEIDTLKAEILIHNCSIQNIDPVVIVEGDSTAWLKETGDNFDTIFIDPARRAADSSRTYNFNDCTPDVTSLQTLLRKHCHRLLIKASPMLDISKTIKEVENLTAVRAVCVNGECKEILTESEGNLNEVRESEVAIKGKILLEAVDLDEDGSVISRFSYFLDTQNADLKDNMVYAEEVDLSEGNYLYEPNAAIMKLAPWSELQKKYPGIKKMAPSSHLFVSETDYDNFPGRKLKIIKIIEKKDRKTLKGFPANIVSRNYPLSAPELRKQLGVKEGKDTFIYATRISRPILILAERQLTLPSRLETESR